jgi:hypothetical protein
MRAVIPFALLLVVVGSPRAGSDEKPKEGESKDWKFEADTPGALPKGFRQESGEWKVAADETAPSKAHVLAQTAKSPGPVFNVVLIDEPSYTDFDLTVRLKAVAGETDQGGGVVWRAKDGKNYYIARWNPLEENFRVYKVEAGKRSTLGNANVTIPGGWHVLRVVMKGEQIECYLDGKKHLEARDATFKEAGKIGLWTKADAETHFDDLAVKKL